MAEYIEREAVLPAVENAVELYPSEYNDIKSHIKAIPAADVAPVVRGRWLKDDTGVICCSECGEEHEWEDYRASYCDTCGAKMEEAR